MSANLQAECALHISDETLSALRDDLLPAAEAERIRAHAATCTACRDRLDGFQRVAAALRGQPVSYPPARLWGDVEAAIASGQRPNHRTPVLRLPSTRTSRPRWTGLGALAAALLIALLFGLVLRSALSGRNGTSTQIQPTSTPSAIAGTPPKWQLYNTPEGVLIGFGAAGMTIAPSDGNTAYICEPINGAGISDAGASQARVAVTRDRGAHWTWQGEVTAGSGCEIQVDLTNPNDLLVSAQADTFRSTDAGRTWKRAFIPGASDTLERFASFGGNVYAITSAYSAQIQGSRAHLAVSTDGTRTWQNIDAGIADGVAVQYWINGSSGDLLAATTTTFWQSSDGGAHWSAIRLADFNTGNYLVQSTAAHTWLICSLTICTTDGGATWTPILALALPSGFTKVEPLALTPGRTLIAVAVKIDPNTAGALATDLFELPAGGARWFALGMPPATVLPPLYEPSPKGGVLWNVNYGSAEVSGLASTFYSASLPGD